VIVDGTDNTTAGVVMGYLGGIVSRYARDILIERRMRMGAHMIAIPSVEDRTRIWYNPELRSVNYMVPGVLAMILMVVTTILTSLAIVREREIGTLEQLIVTPIKATELMIGKTIPFVAIGFIDMTLIMLVARLWFHVPMAGSVLLLYALAAIFLPTSLGLGLFISTVSRTQQQATMTSFFINMPSMLLSGFMFPIANMPKVVQMITYVIPMRYFLEIVRGIFLKGVGIDVLWPQALALLILGVTILSFSAMRFHKRMD